MKALDRSVQNITKLVYGIIILCAIVIFVPSMKEMVFSLIENGKDFQPIQINVGDINVNLASGFELPEFEFDVASFEMPTLTLNAFFIFAAFALVILSSFSPVISIISTIIFSAVALRFSIQTVSVYNNMVANGASTWEAARSCFGVLFCVYLVVLANGLFGLSGSAFKDAFSNAFANCIASIIFAMIFATIGALIVAGICLLLLGLGWAGGIYLGFVVAVLLAAFGELCNTAG